MVPHALGGKSLTVSHCYTRPLTPGQALCPWLWAQESTLPPLPNFEGQPLGCKSECFIFCLRGRPEPSLYRASLGKAWGILLGNSEGQTSVIDHGMLFHIMTNGYSLWSASSRDRFQAFSVVGSFLSVDSLLTDGELG